MYKTNTRKEVKTLTLSQFVIESFSVFTFFFFFLQKIKTKSVYPSLYALCTHRSGSRSSSSCYFLFILFIHSFCNDFFYSLYCFFFSIPSSSFSSSRSCHRVVCAKFFMLSSEWAVFFFFIFTLHACESRVFPYCRNIWIQKLLSIFFMLFLSFSPPLFRYFAFVG